MMWAHGDDIGLTIDICATGALTTGRYDCIMIGAGQRVVPAHLLLFEKLINIVRQHARLRRSYASARTPQIRRKL
jgi:hypothetical protein